MDTSPSNRFSLADYFEQTRDDQAGASRTQLYAPPRRIPFSAGEASSSVRSGYSVDQMIPLSAHSMTELQPLASLPGSMKSTTPSFRFDPSHLSPPLDIDVDRSEISQEDIEMMEKDRAITQEKEDEEAIVLGTGRLNGGYISSTGVRWWEKIFPASWACRFLLLTLVLETLIDLAIEGNILWRFHQEVNSSDSSQLILENRRRLPIYLIIFGLAHLWQLVLAVVCVRSRNTVQVIALTAFNFAFLGYAVVEIYELRQILGDNLSSSLQDSDISTKSLLTLPLNVLTAVVIAVIAVCCVILVILCYFLRREFGLQRYRFLGADLNIRKLYLRFQVFECVCYFSAFFCAGFGIQFIWLVLQKTDVEYIITWVMFPLSIILLIIGRFAAKYESRPSMTGFMIGLLAGCAYFIYKLIRIWQQDSTTYQNLSKSLTLFDLLSLISLVACFIGSVICWMDFGKGLKDAVLSQPSVSPFSQVVGFWRIRSPSSLSSAAGGQTMSRKEELAARRISID